MEEDPLRYVFILNTGKEVHNNNIIINLSMHFEIAVNNQSRNSLLSSQWS